MPHNPVADIAAPWVIERDNDEGLTIQDDRGRVVLNENWYEARALLGGVRAAKVINEIRTRNRALVEIVNDHQKIVDALAVMVYAWRASTTQDGRREIGLAGPMTFPLMPREIRDTNQAIAIFEQQVTKEAINAP